MVAMGKHAVCINSCGALLKKPMQSPLGKQQAEFALLNCLKPHFNTSFPNRTLHTWKYLGWVA